MFGGPRLLRLWPPLPGFCRPCWPAFSCCPPPLLLPFASLGRRRLALRLPHARARQARRRLSLTALFLSALLNPTHSTPPICLLVCLLRLKMRERHPFYFSRQRCFLVPKYLPTRTHTDTHTGTPHQSSSPSFRRHRSLDFPRRPAPLPWPRSAALKEWARPGGGGEVGPKRLHTHPFASTLPTDLLFLMGEGLSLRSGETAAAPPARARAFSLSSCRA